LSGAAGNIGSGRLEMKLVYLTLAVWTLAGCTQLPPVPPEERWSGPYHKGSASGRGYPLWLDQSILAADDEAIAHKNEAAGTAR
jgi:hypothetical protein